VDIFANSMPAGVDPEGVTERFTSFADVLDVRVFKAGNCELLNGAMHVRGNRFAAQVIARKRKGSTWRYRTIPTYVPPFHGL